MTDFSLYMDRKRDRNYRMQWADMGRRARVGLWLEKVVNGYLQEPRPPKSDVSTPEGFYHNEPQYDTLEDRYYGQQGMHRPVNVEVFSFDDMGFGWSNNGMRSITRRGPGRPAGYDNKDWYQWAGQITDIVRGVKK